MTSVATFPAVVPWYCLLFQRQFIHTYPHVDDERPVFSTRNTNPLPAGSPKMYTTAHQNVLSFCFLLPFHFIVQ